MARIAALDAPGPFRVGFRSFEHTYQPVGVPEPRTILVNVWYPTEAEPDGFAHPTYGFLIDDPEALVDAPAAAPVHEGGYPVHVHSHGSQGFGGTSAFLMRHFASQGWVCVAPDHTGNTLVDNWDPRPTAMYFLRSTDITAALDAVGALPSTDPLAAAALDHVLLSSHSFGVHTAWATAGATFDVAAITTRCDAGELTCTPAELAVFAAGVRDPRVVAAIGMAGALKPEWFGTTGHRSVTIPMMSMSGSEDPVGADVQFAQAADTPALDMIWLDLAGGCHQTFALGWCDTLDGETGFRIVRTYAMAFARRHVLGAESPELEAILGGAAAVDPAVSFHHNGTRR